MVERLTYPSKQCTPVIPTECLLNVDSAVDAKRKSDRGQSSKERIDGHDLHAATSDWNRHTGVGITARYEGMSG